MAQAGQNILIWPPWSLCSEEQAGLQVSGLVAGDSAASMQERRGRSPGGPRFFKPTLLAIKLVFHYMLLIRG